MINDETTRFDDALRGHHRASLQQVSPRVLAQLAQRRHSALRGSTPQRSHRLGFAAAGFAALCALAIGVQFRNPPSPGPMPVVATANVTATPSSTDSTMLDQDPDFYAWLASSDAMQVAME
ncbi:hypothetical protein [Thermomonas sp.]|uniref:hypothetical protein n=1 Tax=Thermomonas sp. TaxID=1971895 RepID=UPI002488F988|nr:hypothetical protein [Thermomonas sp.]MDI1254425.1 hypothetical protein [Thermomonas sp.]